MKVTKKNMTGIQVKCPCCGRRLFDMEEDVDGVISIKCGKCSTVLAVSMHHGNHRCRPRTDTRT